MGENLNADLSKRVRVQTSALPWTSSGATATVERKRCFRAGGQESGSVTSIVRYKPGASFPRHPHPEGEEIFVIEGLFSDDRGDFGEGFFLLNPEGFEHAPRSSSGNVIFVRLRQYPNSAVGEPRAQQAIDTTAMPWVPDPTQLGVAQKLLYPLDASQLCYPERQWLEKWDAGTSPAPLTCPAGLEILLLKGSFMDDTDGETYCPGDWLRLPGNEQLTPRANIPATCVLLCKSGGLQFAIPTGVPG